MTASTRLTGFSTAQTVLIGLEGLQIETSEHALLQHSATAGVVLFTRNYRDIPQLKSLTASIREIAGQNLLIVVDHEGGRVQRFREGFTRLPALAVLGRIFETHPERACDLAYRHGRVMATELLLCDVDMSFAPVLDVNAVSCVIGDRAFSAHPEVIAQLGGHYLAGMHDAGMKTCGKHFPGHGSVMADSHVDDVRDPRALADLEAHDLEPFCALLSQLDSLMMAHVVYPGVDEKPAGYSDYWIRHYLRRKLAYKGVIFSDDLGMHAAAVAGKLLDRMARSLMAGCDAVLVCHPKDVRELYAELPEGEHAGKNPLASLFGRNTLTEKELETVGEWRHWRQSLETLEKSQWAQST